MPTPDFEDWLGRQEVDLEDRETLEAYMEYAREEWGLHGGSLPVAEDFYRERYQGLEAYGITAVERHYLYQGEPFAETRYAVEGERGLFGKYRAYEIGYARAIEADDTETASLFGYRLTEMEQAPEKRRTIYQVPRREE